MEYTLAEGKVLDMMERTNFKNLSKNDVISYASKLSELRPEVAKEVLAQFPEFVSLISTSLSEFKGILDNIVDSDDKSIENYYKFASKQQEESSKSRTEFYSLVKEVQADYSKILDTPDLSIEQKLEIMDKEQSLVEIASSKDTEIRLHDEKLETKVNLKDSEKRKFNWKLVSTAGVALITVIGLSASVLGGDLNLKLPNGSNDE
ncbi:hypothetical protein [Streptococcus dysgalactiae]|uniref:hypothetical protein n=1 Tax=Streptococcus dysgalactiae TaxID=1334 RepID=UPI001867C276|nr:hypothetical protein [Streptococcus dysgalactiae]